MDTKRLQSIPYQPISIVILLILFFSVFLSCSSNQQDSRQGSRVVQATGFRAEPQQYTIHISSTGELLSYESVELKTPVAGNVMAIHFKEGQYVQKGALLVEIDSRTWQAQVKGLEAQLKSARKELQRREQLLEMEGASQESVDQAMVSVSDLEARIEELKIRIDLSRIQAPFSGRLGMRNFSPGAFLAQGEMITPLVQSHKLRVDFQIPAQYASLAREGMEVKVASSTTTDTIIARVYAIAPSINPNSRSLSIRAALENDNGAFIPGDFAQVIMKVEQSDAAILIPSESIISELNSQVVYLARNGTVERTEVSIGTSTRGRVHITAGIAEGDTILITGLMEASDGSPVNITGLNQEAGQ